jgi:predicted secreted protein
MKTRFLPFAAVLMLIAVLAGCAPMKSLSGGASPSAAASSAASAPPSPSASAADVSSAAPASSAAPSEAAAADDTGLVSISSSQYEYKSQYIETNIKLPVTELSDSAAADKVNDIFKDYMVVVKENSLSYEAEAKKQAEEGAASPIPYMYDISFGVPYNHGGIFSFVIYESSYLGGAHGSETWYPYIFDAKTGKQLVLSDLMEKGSGYREYFNKAIGKEIDKRAESNELMELAEFTDIGDNPWVYLTADGFLFYFQQYEYFPYAAGIQQFLVPYGDVSKMLKKEYAGLQITPVEFKAEGGNSLTPGDIGRVVLEGNETTGYMWTYEIGDSSILELGSQDYVVDNGGDDAAAGAGGTYSWEFRALKKGTTTIIFTYSRSWDDSSSAEPKDTVQFTVTVK